MILADGWTDVALTTAPSGSSSESEASEASTPTADVSISASVLSSSSPAASSAEATTFAPGGASEPLPPPPPPPPSPASTYGTERTPSASQSPDMDRVTATVAPSLRPPPQAASSVHTLTFSPPSPPPLPPPVIITLAPNASDSDTVTVGGWVSLTPASFPNLPVPSDWFGIESVSALKSVQGEGGESLRTITVPPATTVTSSGSRTGSRTAAPSAPAPSAAGGAEVNPPSNGVMGVRDASLGLSMWTGVVAVVVGAMGGMVPFGP
ncbi:hypothetical protein C8Q76DRAFT_69950 [Earliella scabrosa]|nr:hypothetical protein C8Q76DRAFT_69950 [Earliella scabrosa]